MDSKPIERFMKRLKYIRVRHEELVMEEKMLVSKSDKEKTALVHYYHAYSGTSIYLDFDDCLELVRKNIRKNREALDRLEQIESNVMDALGEEFTNEGA